MSEKNPWCNVPLSIYEGHMSQAEVAQLQSLNTLIKFQLQSYSAARIAILGIAGGNGLEHVPPMVETVYGIDVNSDYLKVCSERFGDQLDRRLKLLELDLREEAAKIPKVDLIVADLIIEYIGTAQFCKKICEAEPQIVTCAIQESEQSAFVSKSTYAEALEEIGKLHQDIDSDELIAEFQKCSYQLILSENVELPQGKRLHRMDFSKI